MIYIGITSSNRAKEKPGVSRLKDRAEMGTIQLEMGTIQLKMGIAQLKYDFIYMSFCTSQIISVVCGNYKNVAICQFLSSHKEKRSKTMYLRGFHIILRAGVCLLCVLSRGNSRGNFA